MRWYVYKCNAGHRVGPYRGDWKLLFDRASQSEEGTGSWGSDEIVEELGRLEIGDNILAYQTDTNSLMGHLVVVEWDMDEEDRHYSVYLRPLLRLGPDGVKVRPMKKINATIAEIWAFKTNEVKTLYHIDEEDARCILRVAQNRCPPKLIERWD